MLASSALPVWLARSNPTVRYVVDLDFTGAVSGDAFRIATGAADSRIKGKNWSNQAPDWRFAQNVTGTIERVGGNLYDVMRMPGSNDYWTQLGTGLNDKNNDCGLSTWILLNGRGCERYSCRGDTNAPVSTQPIPEPSAALAFLAGLGVVGSATRRRR